MAVQLPTGCVENWTGRLVPQPTVSKSAFGTNRQHFARLGRHWQFDVQLFTMTQTKALEWVQLENETDTLLWNIPQGDLVAANEGTPLVAGASQLGTSLNIDGVTPGFVIPQGAYISITTSGQRYVYQVTAAVTASTTSPTGEATLSIQPPLRVSPADNDVVEISSPKLEGYVNFQGLTHARRADNLVRGVSFQIEERG